MAASPNRVLVGLVGAVVLLAAVAGVVASQRESPVLDTGTPEGVTQVYVQAVIDGDHLGAADLLSPTSDCDLDDVSQAYLPDSLRVVLESTDVDGDRAVVTIVVTDRFSDGPFGASEYAHTERVTLAREGGSWLVTGSSWLLPSCGPMKG